MEEQEQKLLDSVESTTLNNTVEPLQACSEPVIADEKNDSFGVPVDILNEGKILASVIVSAEDKRTDVIRLNGEICWSLARTALIGNAWGRIEIQIRRNDMPIYNKRKNEKIKIIKA